MKFPFRIFLPLVLGAGLMVPAQAASKKILLIAGKPSHGPGAHEFRAGCLLLQKCLNAIPGIVSEVHSNGWPASQEAFNGVDAVLIYADGGGGHPAIQEERLKFLDALARQGVGIGCAHYGVEVPKGDPGQALQEWIGGYYEHLYSCNPMWTPEFKSFPDHPVARGVKPFSILDEWYVNMRFRPDLKGVTPILTAVMPDDVRDGPYVYPQGPYPHIMANKNGTETTMWVRERPDGGRGFGFTGGHHHVNWGNDSFRKVVLNALLWIAKVDVPANGVVSVLSEEDLKSNLDPKGQRRAQAASAKPAVNASAAQARWQSPVIKQGTAQVEADIRDAKTVWLVVGDGGDGFGCDWADWGEPRFVKSDGSEVRLTDLKWSSAEAGWGQVRLNKNAGGGPLKIAGQELSYGIGTHAPSVIAYNVAGQGFVKFLARAGVDNGGTDQGCGSTVKFSIHTEKPSPAFLASLSSGGGGGGGGGANRGHGWDAALEDLQTMTVADGLQVTLFAAEPQLVNPANMDIDARGRVWVTEGANYRAWSKLRPEGDRIVILEDTNGDGKADLEKTFYQGTDINSALGICVLGDKVIVSCSPKIMMFTDANGDDKADGEPAVLFNGISGVQHDHGAHAFVFGPDGKLYFNVGNNGAQLKTPDGQNFIVDKAGNEVNGRGRPYRQGLVFRCDMDGSNVETVGWNFRNNYEVNVDSFGTLWQSDNDDDGNRSVRVNYVMEFGNYGYTDELTGAGWNEAWNKANRKQKLSDSEKPRFHWHLDDPGVVPTLLVTGQGSPTGLCVYEGDLLPEVFRGQVIHCDAGPRATRAYPAEEDGAGYKVDVVNVLTSSDSWYRPSDVCVAPDGSLYIADWFDPGVGGHNMQDRDLATMRGRIYRVAPQGHKPFVPELDLSTADGAVAALRSPNMATRYLAWTRLHELGAKAEPALLKLWQDPNPRMKARAIQLLARLEGKAPAYIKAAITDKDPNLRIAGLRMARALQPEVIPYVRQLVRDPSAQVRRECAIALRHDKSADAPALWSVLARQHDGKDRWYLEALGIAADGQEDAFFTAWLDAVGNQWNTPAGRDIVWRSRSGKAPALLVKLITDQGTSAGDRDRYLRALDFIKGPEKDAALVQLITAGVN